MIGSDWKKDVLKKKYESRSTNVAKDRFVKEYATKVKKAKTTKRKPSKWQSFGKSGVVIRRTPEVRRRLGPPPIRL